MTKYTFFCDSYASNEFGAYVKTEPQVVEVKDDTQAKRLATKWANVAKIVREDGSIIPAAKRNEAYEDMTGEVTPFCTSTYSVGC